MYTKWAVEKCPIWNYLNFWNYLIYVKYFYSLNYLNYIFPSEKSRNLSILLDRLGGWMVGWVGVLYEIKISHA